MKKMYFVLLLCIYSFAEAQIINFPDPAFKARLLESGFNNTIATGFSFNSIVIDTNDDGEIDVLEAAQVGGLSLLNSGISDLTGIQNFTNIRYINARNNQITSVDFAGLMDVANIGLANNQISDFTFDGTGVVPGGPLNRIELDLSGNPLQNLLVQGITTNVPTNLFISEIPSQCQINGNLNILGVSPQGTMLDVAIPNFSYLAVNNAPNLLWLGIKNGTNTSLDLENVSQLQYVCTDAIPQEISTISAQYPNLEVNTYCSFVPGGTYYTVNGQIRYDRDGNGCNATDPFFSGLRFNVTDPIFPHSLSASDPNYSISVQGGSHTITPILEQPAYFTIVPTSVTVDFPAQASPLLQDFCVTANGIHTDIEVALVPVSDARPGFDASYKLIFKNKGTVEASGTIAFMHENNVAFVSANPTISSQSVQVLNWNFSGLQPLEQREIILVMNINASSETPAVNDGDVLHYSAIGTTDTADEMTADNQALLNQTVINSLDPNDKTCLEGDQISLQMVGKYVHYKIRFENEGTASAVNIVVKDLIDTNKFDISSLVPLDASHDFITRINGNKVEFIFENIELPFEEGNNDGYVMFKIKTKPTLAIGDSFSNSASIYFDYNHPIVTEPAVTHITLLATKDFEFSDAFVLHPNPAHDLLHLEPRGNARIQSVSIYNTLGQLVLALTKSPNISKIDVSDLAAGNYFLKVTSDKGSANVKWIKR